MTTQATREETSVAIVGQAGDESGLRGYSDTCLARTRRYQEYADW